jgi:hypothetical protein
MADLSAFKIAAAVTRRRTAVFFLQPPANTGVRVGPWLKRAENCMELYLAPDPKRSSLWVHPTLMS